MAIAPGVKTKATTTGALSVTTGALTTTPGSTIALGFVTRLAGGTGTFVSIGDNQGNTYSIIGTQQSSSGGFIYGRLYQCPNILGGAGHTFNVVLSASQEITLIVQEILGSAVVSFDQFNQGTPVASPYKSGATPTTSQAAELILGFFGGDSGSNPATHAVSGSTPAAAGWTVQTEETDGSTLWTAAMATTVVAATGAYEAGFTETGAIEGIVWTASFMEAAANPPRGRLSLLGAGN